MSRDPSASRQRSSESSSSRPTKMSRSAGNEWGTVALIDEEGRTFSNLHLEPYCYSLDLLLACWPPDGENPDSDETWPPCSPGALTEGKKPRVPDAYRALTTFRRAVKAAKSYF